MVNNKQIRNVRTFGADFSQTTTPFSVYAATRQSVDYVVNLWDCLETLSDIDEALMVLQLASEDDTVTLRLNMDGGSHSVGDALIQAMQSCKCEVHVIASGRIASYGTFILLSADSFEISEFATIMCHAASFGSFGKQGTVKEHVMFEHDQCVKMIKHYYKYFLTEAEITRLLEEGWELISTQNSLLNASSKEINS
jgi:ATP-dependent protease ClpP protease subunit